MGNSTDERDPQASAPPGEGSGGAAPRSESLRTTDPPRTSEGSPWFPAKDGKAGGETRRSFRPPAKLRWPVEFELVDDPQPAKRTWATTRDVSVGGTFIETALELPVGTRLRLWLHPPKVPPGAPRVIHLRGEVRWRSDGARRDLARGFGIAFQTLSVAEEVVLHGCFSVAYKVV